MTRLSAILALFLATSALAQNNPANAVKTLFLADTNLVIELVAHEPNVISPVAMAFDASGKIFVAEMTDYPSGPVSGRIRLLEDKDADGLFETATVFATNIAFPNGVMPWRKGILVTAAPDIWYLADTNQDNIADVRELILTGFAEGNQQLRANGLYWGPDNWIYGANGRSDGAVRWATGISAGSIRRKDFRFRPDRRKFEPVAGNSQYGMAYDDFSNRFPVFNNIPVRHVVCEDDDLPAIENVIPISATNDHGRTYARTKPNLLIPQAPGFFSSACGPLLFRGTALPPEYSGRFFVCEPVQNLIQQRKLIPNSSTFIAARVDEGREFLASTDSWFHPVFLANGPDGALYVVDFYRQWVEHPHWVAPELRNKINWRNGENHGRIWRIRHKNLPLAPIANLAKATSSELLTQLANTNGWVRDNAHRLLAEREELDQTDVEAIVQRVKNSPEGQVHAMYLLHERDRLDPKSLILFLETIPEPALKLARQILDPKSFRSWRFTEASLDRIREAALKHTNSPNGRVRLQVALLARDLRSLTALATHPDLDQFQSAALAANAPPGLLTKLLPILPKATPAQLSLLQQLAKSSNSEQLTQWLQQNDSERTVFLWSAISNKSAIPQDKIEKYASTAKEPAARLAAIELLTSDSTLAKLLNSAEPAQIAAAKTLIKKGSSAKVFDQFTNLTRNAKRAAISAAAQHEASALELLKRVPLSEIDPSSRQTLSKFKPAKTLLDELLKNHTSASRAEAIEKLRHIVREEGNRREGAKVYEQACAMCHKLYGFGQQVGPDLSAIGQQSKETLLMHILDPNRQILPDFMAYTATTRDDETHTGILIDENDDFLTLRRPNLPDLRLEKSKINAFKSETKSLMPEQLETSLTPAHLRDLLEFLRLPDVDYFTK